MKKKLTKYSALAIFVLFIALANINGQTPTPSGETVKPRLFPPSLEIVRIEPTIPIENQPLRVYFKFSNDDIVRKVRTGTITGHIFNNAFNVKSDAWKINLQPGQSIEGSLTLNVPPNFKSGKLEIVYTELQIIASIPNKISSVLNKISSASMDIETLLDVDKDGIDDRTEHALIERFRPYYRFSLNKGSQDEYRPTDISWYLQRSELLSTGNENDSPLFSNAELTKHPELVLMDVGKADWIPPKGQSDITLKVTKSDYHINPLHEIAGIGGDDSGRKGNDWATVLAQKNVGLYGHVVPIKLTNAESYDRYKVSNGSDSGQVYYKIEYWQFFGFNEDNIGIAGQHEGDWTTVQLLYNPQTKQVEGVFHYAHGKIEARFNLLKAGQPVPITLPNSSEKFVEYRGENYDKYADLVAFIKNYSNNAVRFSQDPISKEFTHPVVYIEWGAHEFWATEKGFFPFVPNHNGDGYSFLTATPPNLGEVEHSLAETNMAKIILRFNGYWGAYGGPPPGPNLHYQWTYPADSSVRWQLKGLEN